MYHSFGLDIIVQKNLRKLSQCEISFSQKPTNSRKIFFSVIFHTLQSICHSDDKPGSLLRIKSGHSRLFVSKNFSSAELQLNWGMFKDFVQFLGLSSYLFFT